MDEKERDQMMETVTYLRKESKEKSYEFDDRNKTFKTKTYNEVAKLSR